MQPHVLRFADTESLSLAAAGEVAALMKRTIKRQGWCSLVLSGGGSPRRLYELLAKPGSAAGIEWSRVHVFWSDERCVAPDDDRSNYRLARVCLLDHVPLPPANIHRMPGELDPQQAALESEQDIRRFFRSRVPAAGTLPAFDIVLLGMGPDGHVASLFPGQDPGITAPQRLVIAARAPQGMPVEWRLSMSLPLLTNAQEVFLIVCGSEKKPVLDRVLAGGEGSQDYPAARVLERAATTWFIAP